MCDLTSKPRKQLGKIIKIKPMFHKVVAFLLQHDWVKAQHVRISFDS